MSGRTSLRIFLLLTVLGAWLGSAACAMAQTPAGEYVGELAGPFDTPATAQFSHVELKAEGDALSGSWGAYALSGSLAGSRVTLTLREPDGKTAGTLNGTLAGQTLSGTGTLVPARRAGGGGGAATAGEVKWTLSRLPATPAAPKTWNYEPTSFYGFYSATEPPVLHIFPGDTVNTRTLDAAGRDAKVRHTGGDANVGPFYVEGALPGDTLVVKIVKLRTNKPTARQGSRFNQHAITQAYAVAAKYDAGFNGEWTLDPDHNIATLHASDGLPHLTVPMKTMLGCVSVAPPGEEQYRGTDLGPFGGNLDYNYVVQGTTLYFPVFHPGALLGMGDVHAAMGDGEVVGTGLETSADVSFTVDVVRGGATSQVRAETPDYLIAFGVSGSVPESIQLATAQLAEWIKKDYKLNDSEVAILFGAALQYDVTELVDPKFNVAAKIPRSVLAGMK